MHSLKSNGDFLAQEFAKILGVKQDGIEKSASLEGAPVDATVEAAAADSALENSAEDKSLEDDIADMLIEPTDEGANMASDSLDEAVDELNAYDGLDDKHAKIMLGLNKIATSLRGKDESFAADVVEATALSIMDDLKKEAARSNFVCDQLSKIAADLDASGDDFSADMVRVTLSRIKNS